MATPAAVQAPDSRQRFIDAAVRLFIRHSFAGTSLQMIAEEVGVTKSAVHHHFRTREDLLTAVVTPLISQFRGTIEAAEAHRSRPARAEHLLAGFVDIVVRNRSVVAILAGDPGVIEMLRAHPELPDLINRQNKLITDLEPGPGGQVKAAVVFAGIAGAVRPNRLDLDETALRQHLLDAARRTLGLRTPPRPR